MAVEYTWTWGPMRVENVEEFNDAVTGIAFVCIAKDTNEISDLHGKMSGVFAVPPVDPGQYVPLSSLTDTIVNDWITNYFNKTEWEEIALNDLNQQLNSQVKIVPMP